MTIQAIGTDNIAASGANQTTTSGAGFSSVMDTTATVLGSMGPAFVTTTDYLNPSATAISSVAVNSAYNGAAVAAGGSPSYTSSLGNSYSSGYYTGGSPMYSSTGTETGDLSSSVENILSETATSQAYLIGIQAQLGQQQSTFTAISNALNVKYGMERSAIQNFRV